MKTEKKLAYEAPQIEVFEVKVEKGFAQSDGTGNPNGFGNGGPWNE